MPKGSVIVVNYNGKDLITSCLKALERQTFKDFEIIVVDNGSLDGSVYEIRKFLKESPLAPFVKLVLLDKNLGFAGGNIEGLKYAKGKYIALLNNDAVADKNWLHEIVKVMDTHSEVGICASKIIAYGKNIIDSAGDGFSTLLKGFKRGEGELTEKYNTQEYTFGACAAAALYRRKMLDEIGFMDEDFFLIHEDTDLNLRAQLSGWKVLYVPAAIVHHKVRSTIGQMSDTAIYYTLRNSEFTKIKNIPFGVLVRCLPELIILMIMEFIYFAIKHRHPILYFKAKLDAVKMLPNMLKKRRVNLKGMKIDRKDLRKIMTPVFERSFLRNKLNKLIFG